MAIQVNELRFSLISLEVFQFDTLKEPPGFINRFDYYNRFGELTKPENIWKLPRDSNFWKYYLSGVKLGSINSDKAWKGIIPFSLPSIGKIEAPDVRVHLEGFYYPHCIALVVNVFMKGDWDIDTVVQKAVELRNDTLYDVTWADETTDQQVKMNELMFSGLDHLRQIAVGDNAPQGKQIDPFTISTFINCTGVDTSAPVQPNSDIHKALDNLCQMRLIAGFKPESLDKATVRNFKDNENTPSHLLYKLDRSRAVWFPGFFGIQNIRKLGCYHRNLTMMTLHVESLVALMEIASQYIAANEVISGSVENLARLGAGILGRLFGGMRDSYRSNSIYEQIVDNNYITAINEARNYFRHPLLVENSV